MLKDDLLAQINDLRRFGSDHSSVEAKASRKALPQRLWETLSAFSNTSGGTIILGLNEDSGFEIVGIEDVKKVQADLTSMCAEMEPVLRPQVQLFELESQVLLVAEIPELPVAQKPCYHRPQGLINGSYLRVGDSDRKMNAYELHAIQEAKGQPRQDTEPVPDTSLTDLDPDLLQSFLRRIRNKGRNFQNSSDEQLLDTLKVTVQGSEGNRVLSLGGLLCLGAYPQALFPNLCLTVVRYPGQYAGDLGPQGERFLENVKLEGPIPYIAQEALQVIKRNIQRRDIIQGLGRTEQWEYPELVLRESIVNALAHRDLSYMARGSHVQVQLYPDRLEIISPGGLYGPIQPEQLGIPGVQSSRNEFLIKILEDLPLPHDNHTLCEGRGSGITAMLSQLRQAGMSPPHFDITLTRFKIYFWNHTLLRPDILSWVSQITMGQALSESQRKNLAYLYHTKTLTNTDYCRVSGVDSRIATKELKQLVDLGILERVNHGRWAQYQLPSSKDSSLQGNLLGIEPNKTNKQITKRAPSSQKANILKAFGESSQPLTVMELANHLNIPITTARYWVRRLFQEDRLIMETPHPNSPTTSYRLKKA